MAMTTFSYVSTVLTQVNITKPCLIGGLSTGDDAWVAGAVWNVAFKDVAIDLVMTPWAAA